MLHRRSSMHFWIPTRTKMSCPARGLSRLKQESFFALVRTKKDAVSRLIEAHRGSNRDLFRFFSFISYPKMFIFLLKQGSFSDFFQKDFRLEFGNPMSQTTIPLVEHWFCHLVRPPKKPRCHQQASKCIPWGVRGTFIWVCLKLQANCFLNPFKQHFGKIANSLNCTFTLKSSWDLLLKALQSHLHKALQICGQMFYIFVWQIDLQIKKIMESKTRHNYEKHSHTFFFDFINVKILKMSSRPFSRKGVSRKGVSRTLDLTGRPTSPQKFLGGGGAPPARAA